VVNIGNFKPIQLLDFVGAIEDEIGAKTVKNLLPKQAGDVIKTWEDNTLLENLTGYIPSTNVRGQC